MEESNQKSLKKDTKIGVTAALYNKIEPKSGNKLRLKTSDIV